MTELKIGDPSAIAKELARTNSFGDGGAYGNVAECVAAALRPWVAKHLDTEKPMLLAQVAELIARGMLLQHEADTGRQPDAIVALAGARTGVAPPAQTR